MTAISKAATVAYGDLSKAVLISEFFSGDSFAFLDPVYIDSLGKVKAAGADSVSERYVGFAGVGCDSVAGHPVTIIGAGAILTWLEDSDAYVPGTLLYVGASGGLDDAATPASPVLATLPVARVISKTEIQVLR